MLSQTVSRSTSLNFISPYIQGVDFMCLALKGKTLMNELNDLIYIEHLFCSSADILCEARNWYKKIYSTADKIETSYIDQNQI